MGTTATTEALVLRRFDSGEADRVVWLLTPGRGRVSAIAAPARRSQRRFGGALEPFTRLSVELTAPTHGDLFRLIDAEILDGHLGIRASLEATSCASAAVELVAAFSVDGGVPQKGRASHYEVLLAYFRRLSQHPPEGDDLYRFVLMALDVAGVRPRFDACARCGQTEAGDHACFAPGEGGRLCERCRPRSPGARPLPRPLLEALQAFEASGTGCPPEGRALLCDYAQEQVGKPFKSLELLRELGL